MSILVHRRVSWVARAASALIAGASPAATQTAGPPTPAVDSSRVEVLSLTSQVFRNTRAIRVYLPPGYDAAANAARRYPVLYLNDGFAVFSPRGWNAPRTLDSLVRGNVIPPLIVVGIDNAASIPGATTPIRDRASEFLPYPDSTEPDLPRPRGEEYPRFVVDEVVPLVTRTFRTLEGPANTGIGGSSYGGVAALVTVLRRPGVFGKLLLESTPLFLFRGRLLEEARDLASWPSAVYVGVGTRETDDARVLATGRDALERFVSAARAISPAIRVQFTVAEGATHTSQAWGARLAAALAFLYGNASRGGVSPQARGAGPAGQLVERIVSGADSTQAYALFLPSGYGAGRRWPILFALDPRGRALLPLQRLRPAAEERGFIVMSSYNSVSDGPLEPNVAAMNAMLADAQRALSIDERRLYIVGFSGTSRVAWVLARELGEHVAGIIGVGAGTDRSFFGPDSTRRTISFYGSAGRRDFNYEEMRAMDALLDTLGVPHRFSYFAGRHEWAPEPVLTAAVEWLDFRAMRQGLRAYDSVWVKRLAARHLAAARSLEADGPVAEALEAYRAIAADFADLPEGSEAAARASSLADRPDLRAALAERTRLGDASARYRAVVDLAVGALNARRPPPRAHDLARLLRIDSLKADAARSTGDRADAAQRLLEFAFVITSFYQPRYYIERGDHERALIVLEVAAMIDAESPRLCVQRGYAFALAGRAKDAVRNLECARRAGVLTTSILADRTFDPIRGSAEFRRLLGAGGPGDAPRR